MVRVVAVRLLSKAGFRVNEDQTGRRGSLGTKLSADLLFRWSALM